MSKASFYICKHCGNLVEKIEESGVPMICCGEDMEKLVPNTEDASTEKHVPVVKVENGIMTVEVGEIPHPMATVHYIQWIYLQTEQGCMRKDLIPGNEAKATFYLGDDVPLAVYEFCNVHGLWGVEV